jgi:hypothetical protein
VTSGRRSALQVRLAIEAAHPEIQITAPLASRSGKWELSTEGSTTAYEDFWTMIDELADRYGDDL